MENLQNIVLYLIAISGAVFVFSLIMLALHKGGQEKDAFQKRLDNISGARRHGEFLDEEMNKPFTERVIKPASDKLMAGLKKVAPQASQEAEQQQDSRTLKLKTTLRQAGMKLTPSEYRGIQILVIIGTGILAGLITFMLTTKWLFAILAVLFGLYLAFVVMRFQLASRVSSRKRAMQKQLPDILDMISVSVEAGLGLEQAMVEVVKNFDGPLIEEIEIANREMAMGRTRSEALHLLGERCGLEEVETFTRAIIQATQMGIAVKNVLRTQSEYIRQTHKHKVEEKAMKVSVKILLPMAFFILPVMFIVLLGPAVVSIIEGFS